MRTGFAIVKLKDKVPIFKICILYNHSTVKKEQLTRKQNKFKKNIYLKAPSYHDIHVQEEG